MRRFDGEGTWELEGDGEEDEVDEELLSPLDEGARECDACEGEVGRAEGGLGRDRKARWS